MRVAVVCAAHRARARAPPARRRRPAPPAPRAHPQRPRTPRSRRGKHARVGAPSRTTTGVLPRHCTFPLSSSISPSFPLSTSSISASCCCYASSFGCGRGGCRRNRNGICVHVSVLRCASRPQHSRTCRSHRCRCPSATSTPARPSRHSPRCSLGQRNRSPLCVPSRSNPRSLIFGSFFPVFSFSSNVFCVFSFHSHSLCDLVVNVSPSHAQHCRISYRFSNDSHVFHPKKNTKKKKRGSSVRGVTE